MSKGYRLTTEAASGGRVVANVGACPRAARALADAGADPSKVHAQILAEIQDGDPTGKGVARISNGRIWSEWKTTHLEDLRGSAAA